MDAARPDNSSEGRSSLQVTEPSNLHACTNVAALIRAIRGASSFRVDPGSEGVGSGADAAWLLTNSGLAMIRFSLNLFIEHVLVLERCAGASRMNTSRVVSHHVI